MLDNHVPEEKPLYVGISPQNHAHSIFHFINEEPILISSSESAVKVKKRHLWNGLSCFALSVSSPVRQVHLERNTELLLKLMQHLDCRISDEELRAIAAEKQLARRLSTPVQEADRPEQPS